MAEFSEQNQPKQRKPRGPAKLKKAIPLFESLGISPLTEAIKEIVKIKQDPAKKAALWLDVASFIYPRAKEDNIPTTPEESVGNVQQLFVEALSKADNEAFKLKEEKTNG
jgi:hypothetical protein